MRQLKLLKTWKIVVFCLFVNMYCKLDSFCHFACQFIHMQQLSIHDSSKAIWTNWKRDNSLCKHDYVCTANIFADKIIYLHDLIFNQ